MRRLKYWKDLLTPTMATANVDFPVPFAPVMIIPFGCLAVTIFSTSSSLKQVQQSHALIKLNTLWKQLFQFKIIKHFARQSKQFSHRKLNKYNFTKYIVTAAICSSYVGTQHKITLNRIIEFKAWNDDTQNNNSLDLYIKYAHRKSSEPDNLQKNSCNNGFHL